MSRNSSKNAYVQLMEWLPTVVKKSTSSTVKPDKFSKADHYKSRGVR